MKPMPLRLFLKMSAMLGLMASPVLRLFERRKQYVTSCPADEMVGLFIEFSETRPPTTWKTCQIVEWCESPMLWNGEFLPNPFRNKFLGKSVNPNEPDTLFCFWFKRDTDEVVFADWPEIKAYRTI